MKKIIIIGAGPAGLSAAVQLSKNNEFDITLIEKSSEVGGLAKTLQLWGQPVDLGPHRFFSHEKIVNSFWKEFVGPEYSIVNRVTRIYYLKKFFYYPLQITNLLKNLGIKEIIHCLFSYLFRHFQTSNPDSSYENWLKLKFGTRLYHLFFKSYSEKLWGKDCQQIDVDFAKQRIKGLNMAEIFKKIFFYPIFKKPQHKSLVDHFIYPHKGAGSPYQNMAELFLKNGGTLYLSSSITQLHFNGDHIVGVNIDQQYLECNALISTMPLTQFLDLFPLKPLSVTTSLNLLTFRNTILVYVNFQSSNLFHDQWIYIQDKDIKCGRITNFENWNVPTPKNKNYSVLSFEYWCSENDPIWNSTDSEIRQIVLEDISKINIFSGVGMNDFFIKRIPKSYPIYHAGYQKNLLDIKNYLSSFKNIQVIGRYGSFKYNNQDHSILMGLCAAHNLHNVEKIDLWNINEGGNYQESFSLDEETFRN